MTRDPIKDQVQSILQEVGVVAYTPFARDNGTQSTILPRSIHPETNTPLTEFFFRSTVQPDTNYHVNLGSLLQRHSPVETQNCNKDTLPSLPEGIFKRNER